MKTVNKIATITLIAFAATLAVFADSPTATKAADPFTAICDSKDVRVPAGADVTADQPTVCKEVSKANPISGKDGVILKALGLLRVVGGAGATIMIIYLSLRLIASNGDSGALKKVRDNLIYSSIGLVVLMLAPEIIKFIINQTN